jgi:hypothetical protein
VEALINRDDLSEEAANQIYQSFLKIVHPEQMGKKFKVLSIISPKDLKDQIVGFPPSK